MVDGAAAAEPWPARRGSARVSPERVFLCQADGEAGDAPERRGPARACATCWCRTSGDQGLEERVPPRNSITSLTCPVRQRGWRVMAGWPGAA